MTSNGKKIKQYFSKSILTSKISDNEFDTLLNESISKLFDRALTKTLLDKNDCLRTPRRITGPKMYDIGGAEFKLKKGKDNFIRYIPIGITIINFTQHEIVFYQCVFDPITENPLNESTSSYFYTDVVSIETKSESVTHEEFTFGEKVVNEIPLIGKLINNGTIHQYNVSEKFILTTSGSSWIEVRLSENVMIEEVGGEFSTSDADNAIRSIRQMLRDKKR
ncbi:hypothetical protein [Aquimarina macrocephali]|uniref:hypothetical protein n=1 Tax=Aquimarina macrocephali TaxID=666563 RepID=UPI000466F64C|nr:hypothetical protein [Aquimarina macrocephali]